MMGKKAEDGNQTEIDDVEELEQDEGQNEDVSAEDESGADHEGNEPSDEESEGSDDEVVVSIGEESPPHEEEQRAPKWVNELRKSDREKSRRIRELEAKLNQSTETKPVVLGAKPKLEDHDYDAEKFEQALSDWYERKRTADQAAEQAKAAEKAQQEEWNAQLDGYSKAKAALKVRDFDDAESTAQEILSIMQQSIVVKGADNPALVIYALGKSPKKAAEIASIKDPVKFSFAVAKLEKELKVTNRKAAPPPEKTVSGTGRVSGAVDATLERLRAEADKTGDRSKVIAYRRKLKQTA